MKSDDIKDSVEKIEFSRARGFYLYSKGRRYVDLDLCSGSALWGHGMAPLANELKKTISKALLPAILTQELRRFIRAFMHVFPGFQLKGLCFEQSETSGKYRILRLTEHLAEAARTARPPENSSIPIPIREFLPSASTNNGQTPVFVWRPYSGISLEDVQTHYRQPLVDSAFFAPIIPFPWPGMPLFLCQMLDQNSQEHQKELRSRAQSQLQSMVEFRELSPVLLGGLSLGLHLLRRWGSLERRAVGKFAKRDDYLFLLPTTVGGKRFKKLRYRALPLPADSWKQQGIYVLPPPMEEDEYREIRTLLFQHGFYISADRGLITLPYYFTRHEMKSWEAALSELEYQKLGKN